ncbi:MAG: ABC transporter ATP-binding protein [Alphaproteobacteria bacterium]|nr:MAG: ABC transporter ATP-binding protein [Alphaproteobacteria bacterium]
MAEVAVQGITKRFGTLAALDDVSIDFADGGFYGLLGPSGSGKTTLLRIIAGFLFPDAGTVRIGGEPVEGVPVERRRIGMVFQNYALFPNMSVAENIGFGLRVAGLDRAARSEAVREALALVQLEGLGARRPHQLSGGQRQRVALARAIVTRPRVLLLDEPLSALDKALRTEMQIELKRIQRETGLTTIFVTHDQEEAMTLSDRIGILRDGALIQEGTPQEVYNRPRTRFAAEFLGAANVFEGKPVAGGIALDDGTVLRFRDHDNTADLLAVRPENVVLQPANTEPPAGWNVITGTVIDRVFAGPDVLIRLDHNGQEVRVILRGHQFDTVSGESTQLICWQPRYSIPLEA